MRTRRIYRLAATGDIPAETLRKDERERLVRELHTRGMSDLEIADHTRETEYTIARIRTRLGLAQNRGAA